MTTRKKRKTQPRPRPNFHRLPPEPIPQNWTDDQAIAVYDFCSVLQELVWRRYQDALSNAALDAQLQASAARGGDNRTHPLPFNDDDDLPF